MEARHDVGASARRIAAALDLPVDGVAPIGRLATALADLGTPLVSAASRRAAGVVTGLGPSGVVAAARTLRW